MTRGIRGTFVYVCDPALRKYLRQYLSPVSQRFREIRFPSFGRMAAQDAVPFTVNHEQNPDLP